MGRAVRLIALAFIGLVGLVGLAALATPAHAEPSDQRLLVTGIAMAPPTYVAGVALHEGSHALAALLVGARVEQLHLFPPGIDPATQTFRFGWTYVRGLRTRGDHLAFFLAPKVTDVALLGGFAALVLSDAWPHNAYGQLALTVFATGLWIDFSKDVLLFSRTNDVVKVFDLWCLHGWRQIPARAVYAGMIVGLGALVARGYQRTFDHAPSQAPTEIAAVVPLLATAF